MIWAIWREIYRQDLCLSFNQWLLRVISVNRCLIFKVHPHSWTASTEPFLKWALLLYQTLPLLSTLFFILFYFFPLFFSPFFNFPVCCFLAPFFSFCLLFFHVVDFYISYTICCFSLPFLLFVDISWFCFLCCFFYFLCSFFLLIICIFISFLST